MSQAEEPPAWMSEKAKELWRLGGPESSDEGDMDDEDDLDDLETEDDEDEDEEFPWLKSLNGCVKEPNGTQVGHCHAKLIDRKPIRATFWREMQEPSHDTASLGFDLFDRWGRLRPELYQHPIKKGTSVWGSELDNGKFLLIERLVVQEEYKRQGYGRKLVTDIWNQALRKVTDCSFAVTWASVLNNRDFDVADDDVVEKLQGSVEDFWRSVGFRRVGSSPWFAKIQDSTHPSLALGAAEDYRRPFALRRAPLQEGQEHPFRNAMLNASDEMTLASLKSRLRSNAANDPLWLAADGHGNTIMHVLATQSKSKSIAWLLKQPSAATLSDTRNLSGETSLETLEAALEARRTKKELGMMTTVASDEFDGFQLNEIKCLELLAAITRPSNDQMLRLKFGCTCGRCIGGYISPRTSFELQCQADIAHDMIRENIADTTGSQWCEYWDHYLAHVGPAIMQDLRTKKSLRLGFTNLFHCISQCLHRGQLPTTSNVSAYAQSERTLHVKSFLDRGGLAASAVLVCFMRVIEEDIYLGDGQHEETFRDEIRAIPPCRNDREFGFASRQYCISEGLPAEASKANAGRMGSYFS